LNRGGRMMELLKQPQYSPMPMPEQVVVLYAGTQGYVDDLPLEEAVRFGREVVVSVRERHPSVIQAIRDTGRLAPEIEKELQSGIQDFVSHFKTALSGKAAA
jgi:F-type H+-transporting ATPase subunit alpha